mmetsp:Transcript_10150/g.15481  ORF Transcript_10150/g.15481 Transcript_10150/m.15481 type:complete len:177 (-) Transcript_10150:3550-4080(-)
MDSEVPKGALSNHQPNLDALSQTDDPKPDFFVEPKKKRRAKRKRVRSPSIRLKAGSRIHTFESRSGKSEKPNDSDTTPIMNTASDQESMTSSQKNAREIAMKMISSEYINDMLTKIELDFKSSEREHEEEEKVQPQSPPKQQPISKNQKKKRKKQQPAEEQEAPAFQPELLSAKLE